jgi:hypothetical protein
MKMEKKENFTQEKHCMPNQTIQKFILEERNQQSSFCDKVVSVC